MIYQLPTGTRIYPIYINSTGNPEPQSAQFLTKSVNVACPSTDAYQVYYFDKNIHGYIGFRYSRMDVVIKRVNE